MSDPATEPQTPPVFSLSKLFDHKLIIKTPESRNAFFAIGLDVTPISDKRINEIHAELMAEALKEDSFSVHPGEVHILIDNRLMFSKICSKIDQEIRINSPQEFFYAVSVAITIVNKIVGSGIGIGNLGLSGLKDMLQDLFERRHQRPYPSDFNPFS